MNQILKWPSTVEYFNEDGIELNLKHLTQTEIKKQFKKINENIRYIGSSQVKGDEVESILHRQQLQSKSERKKRR